MFVRRGEDHEKLPCEAAVKDGTDRARSNAQRHHFDIFLSLEMGSEYRVHCGAGEAGLQPLAATLVL